MSKKRILVTGASQGIGRACAIALSRQEGVSVVLVARNQKKLEETFQQMSHHENHLIVPYDFHDLDHIEDIFKQSVGSGTLLNGLVHAAGIGPIIPMSMLSAAKINEVFTINYFSFLLLVKFFLKSKYHSSESPSIVAVSSVNALKGKRGLECYSGSKAAIDASIRSLTTELASKNIRINSVLPACIKTSLLDEMTYVLPPEEYDKLVARHPLGLGETEDVVNAVLFLLSEKSRYITGSQLIIDGGYMAQ